MRTSLNNNRLDRVPRTGVQFDERQLGGSVIEFIAAVYNEQEELAELVDHVSEYVDRINIVDDGSTDRTPDILNSLWKAFTLTSRVDFEYEIIPHTGLPETVKSEALKMVHDGSWVIMLDADERFAKGVLDRIKDFCVNETQYDYVYCPQIEVIDNKPVRDFQKCKVFRKEAITFPLNNIHADDSFKGEGTFRSDWHVIHRKSSNKQRIREKEYLETYKSLLDAGKIDRGRYNWLVNLHHYER